MKYINNIDERADSKQDLSFLLEGVMSDLHLLAKKVKTEDEFIKKFFKEHGDKVKKTPDSVEWVKSLYKDTVGEPVTEGSEYKIGDKYKKDFDYYGMIEMGSKAKISMPIKKLQQLFDSFESVNYHREGSNLSMAIDELKDKNKKDAKFYMDLFNQACEDTLENMKESVTEGKKEDKLIRAAEANLTKVLADLKANLTKFKNAQTPEEKEKYKTEAGRLTKLRKAAQADLDSAIVNLHKDAELNIKENKMEHIKTFEFITEAEELCNVIDKETKELITDTPIRKSVALKLAAKKKGWVIQKHDESVNEAFIGPFVFNDKMSDDELKAMYDAALDGYSYYQKGFQHAKSKYKQAYQEIEKILKKRGVKGEDVKERTAEAAKYISKSVKEARKALIKRGDLSESSNYTLNEKKWEVLGSIGNFQVFPDKENGDHIILILGRGGDQREYPIYLKSRDTVDKLQDRYYHGRSINIKESVNVGELNEAKFTKKSLMRAMKKDDGMIQLGNGQEYVIYAFGNGNDDNDDMWGDKTIFALDQDGGEHEIKYSDIVRYDESVVNESIMYQWLITEGQFSWLTQDGGEQIGSERANTITVCMYDNKGNKWIEKKYEGYGVFGGMDYYDLVATMNGYKADRQIGIDLAFNKIKTKDKGRKTLFPALVSNPRFNWKQHDFTQEAENDPNQSWY